MPEIYRSQHAGSIADLMRQRGMSAANRARMAGDLEAQKVAQSGQVWGNAIQGIAQGVTGTLRDFAQSRQDAPAQVLRQRQADTLAQELSQMETAAAQKKIGELASMVRANNYDPATAEPVFRAIAKLSPEYEQPLLRSLMEPAMLKNVTDTLISQTPGYKAPNLIQRDPTKDLINEGTGAIVQPGVAAPPEPEKPVVVGGALVRPSTGEAIYTSPEKPAATTNVTESQLAMMAAQGNQQAAAALERLRALRAPQPQADNEPLIQIVGPDGKPVYARRSEAVGKQPPSGSQKPATGLEKRALNFFNRASQADTDLESMESQVQGMGLAGQTYMEWAPNFMQTELGQQYTQAQRAFTEARLRKDSGAAIPEQEFANDRKTYFAQPGDSKETLEQKRRARAAVLASLAFESGQALGEFLGDAEEAARVVSGYRQRSQKPQTVDQVPQGTLKPGQTVQIGGFTVRVKP